jgi:hypothetical protein
MAASASLYFKPAALLLLPLVAWAQVPTPQVPAPQTPSTQPPPAVDQALRSRVSEFLQDFVDKQYRKALKYVAEESQDLYFGSAKAELRNFKIDDIKYDDNFQNATVYFTSDRSWKVHFEGLTEVPITVQMSSTWKIEDGQWVWFYKDTQPWVTAMGPSNADLITKAIDGTVKVPNIINQDTADAAASKILEQSHVDKLKVSLLSDKASSDRVVLHNGVNGEVGVELIEVPAIPGLSIKSSKIALHFGEEAVVDVTYTPPADQDPNFVVSARPFGIAVHPFEQIFWIRIDFGPSAPAKQ